MASTEVKDVVITSIHSDGRHRKTIGDLSDLCKSIEAVGLIHPIVITKQKKLVAGSRRIAAYMQLGRVKIPAVVAGNMDDATKLLTAERDENTCRLDFTPTEAASLGMALEELERPAANKRKTSGKNQHSEPSENFTEASKGDTREIVGKAVGMSGPTYQRAKAVTLAAQDDPNTFGPIADEMDRTGKVLPAFEKVQAIKNGSPGGKKKHKRKSLAKFDEQAYVVLCDQLRNWVALRFDKAGGAESRDECDKLLGQITRSIEKWQKQKPLEK